MRLLWQVYADNGSANPVAAGGTVLDKSKHSVSKNPLTNRYYRLHILNVEVSDLKKYRCQALVNGKNYFFYIKLDFLGRCNYILVILMWRNRCFLLMGNKKIILLMFVSNI